MYKKNYRRRILGRWQNRKHLGSVSPPRQQSNWQNWSDVTLYWGDLESTEGLQLPWEGLGDKQLISVSFSSHTAVGSHPPLQPHGRQHTHFLSNLHTASGSHGDQKGHCPPNTGDLCSDCCCFFSFLLQLVYSVVLVSSIQQSESVIHIYLSRYISLFFRCFSHIGHYIVLSRVSCVIQQVLFYITSVYMSIPISQHIPPPPLPPVTINLFSMPVTLFLFCE